MKNLVWNIAWVINKFSIKLAELSIGKNTLKKYLDGSGG